MKNLKNICKNPVVVHSSVGPKPHYLKMTFSMCRNAVNGERFLELSKMQQNSKNNQSELSTLGGSSALPPLLKAGKEQ